MALGASVAVAPVAWSSNDNPNAWSASTVNAFAAAFGSGFSFAFFHWLSVYNAALPPAR